MQTTPFPFRVLFCFENSVQLLLEIKRTDIQSEDKSKVYQWLRIEKSTPEISRLHFQAMDASGEQQSRTFAEGELTWNSGSARFNDEELSTVTVNDVANEWLELIAGSLI
jgi:hypothetical protein